MTPHSARVLPPEPTSVFCARWGVSELYVFGSASRGELHEHSDLDVAVRFHPDVRYSLFDLVDMKEELSQLTGRPVDLFTLRGIEHMANSARRESILGSLELVHAA